MTDRAKPTVDAPAARVRLDRWLWAARFFKTRAQSKAAIEAGKVHLHPQHGAGGSSAVGLQKPKVSKEIAVGDRLEIRRGLVTQTIDVVALSEQRGSAPVAQALYQETTDSIEARETERARRALERAGLKAPQGRPSKRDRRERLKLRDSVPTEGQ